MLPVMLLAKGYDYEQGVLFGMAVLQLLVASSQLVAERFIPKSSGVPKIQKWFHRLAPLGSLILLILSYDNYGFRGHYHFVTTRILTDNVTWIIYVAAMLCFYLMIDIMQNSMNRQPDPRLQWAFTSLVAFNFLQLNIINALQFEVEKRWLRGLQYFFLSILYAAGLMVGIYGFHVVRHGLQNTIALLSRHGVGAPEAASRGKRGRISIMENSIRRMRRFEVLLIVLGAIAVLYQQYLAWKHFLDGFDDDKINDRDPNDYSPLRSLLVFIQYLTLWVMIWYTWTPLYFIPFLSDCDSFFFFLTNRREYVKFCELNHLADTTKSQTGTAGRSSGGRSRGVKGGESSRVATVTRSNASAVTNGSNEDGMANRRSLDEIREDSQHDLDEPHSPTPTLSCDEEEDDHRNNNNINQHKEEEEEEEEKHDKKREVKMNRPPPVRTSMDPVPVPHSSSGASFTPLVVETMSVEEHAQVEVTGSRRMTSATTRRRIKTMYHKPQTLFDMGDDDVTGLVAKIHRELEGTTSPV